MGHNLSVHSLLLFIYLFIAKNKNLSGSRALKTARAAALKVTSVGTQRGKATVSGCEQIFLLTSAPYATSDD